MHHLLPTGEVGIYMAIILSSVCVCGKQISQLSESIWISHPRACYVVWMHLPIVRSCQFRTDQIQISQNLPTWVILFPIAI